MVEDVPLQQNFTGPAPELPQVGGGRPQGYRTVVDLGNGGGVQEQAPAPDPDHHAGHGRVPVATMDPGHQVDQFAHVLAGLVPHRDPYQAGQRNELASQDPAGHNPLGKGVRTAAHGTPASLRRGFGK